ncbi:L-threonylcarbamoyladenylate synthase [Ureaplasma canigenitalium]|uniref:L-threonylcarbamoyladenylate synthase n=1 Tax=Ureaplasma canigenitalium TaxID=42092 RepID=UPI0004E20845|nr:L-threonylcarbamoyladenylate synthase [Ureaplasma canigenitalium]
MKTYKITDITKMHEMLQNNGCVCIPTDTIMGLLAKNEDIIYSIKKRDRNKKLVLFVKDYQLLKNLTVEQEQFLNLFWPGPLTVIKDGISYRMPNCPSILKLIDKLGPLYCSSANITNEKPVQNTQEAIFKFGSNSKILYIEGKQKVDLPSTIVDIDKWEYIRKGEKVELIDEYIKELKSHE